MTTSLVLLAPVPELEFLERLGWGRNNILPVVAPSTTHTPAHRGCVLRYRRFLRKRWKTLCKKIPRWLGARFWISGLARSASGISKLFLEAADLVRLNPPAQD